MSVSPEARELLESAAIYWRRDWDAIALGILLGIMATKLFEYVW